MFFFLSDVRCKFHRSNGPENAQRWIVLDQVLSDSKVGQKLEIVDHDEKSIQHAIITAHSSKYLNKVIRACQLEQFISTSEVRVCKDSIDAVYAGVGSGLTAVDHIASSDEKSLFVFCNVRSPGHHAGYESTSGFCIFNNVAIAAIYAIEKYPTQFKHVAIFDFDLHYGNGTVSILSHHREKLQDTISFYSIHQSKCFPNTKASNSIKSIQKNIYNRSLPAYCTLEQYLTVFTELVEIMQTNHKPDLIVVSCGFDSCVNEKIGQFPLLPSTYKSMTSKLLQVCPRMVSLLEGGYELTSITKCLEAHLSSSF